MPLRQTGLQPYDSPMNASHAQRSPARPDAEELNSPRTQIVTDRDAYLGQGRHDVGRRIADDQVELFVTADVPGSLQKEFMLHTPEFVAVHDIGTSASLRLLSSMASAAGGPVQRLSIRRQGHGVALAVLQFVEVALPDGTPMRLYSTDLNADTATRTQVARVLLAFSRLGVILVGELPPHALKSQLAPLHEALSKDGWPNRDLLLVPLGSGTAMAAQGAQLAGQQLGGGACDAPCRTPPAGLDLHQRCLEPAARQGQRRARAADRSDAGRAQGGAAGQRSGDATDATGPARSAGAARSR